MMEVKRVNFEVTFSVATASILICILCFNTSTIHAQTANYFGSECSNTTSRAEKINSSRNAYVYKANVRIVLSSLSSGAGEGLKYQNATAGNETTNMVYGQYDCRADAKTNFCQFCVYTAGNDVVQRCPESVSAVIWYDVCILRYSNQKFFGNVTTSPSWHLLDNRSISDLEEPDKAANFMHSLIRTATIASRPLLYATGGFNLNGSEKRYGFVQCSRDLSGMGCSKCLESLLSQIRTCCQRNKGWMVVAPSCFMRYADVMFFDVDESPTLDQASAGHEQASAKSRIVIITISSGVAVVLLGLGGYSLWKRNTNLKRGQQTDTSVECAQNSRPKEDSLETDLPLIPLSVVENCTDHFSEESKLGQGGFGSVYKGVFPDGKHVAVKRLSRTSSQGVQEFKNEVVLIAKLQHRNLVRLVGCCIEGGEKLLVYEYMHNSSLDFHLFGKSRGSALDWNTRVNIITGISKGLLYLHEDSRLRVIHRDLKASNILLDDEMNPKISDFGLARTFGGDQGATNTRRVMGTYGYMSPEYAMEGLFSIKSDVFSFGVLLLEIVSGKRNSGFQHSQHGQSLLAYAWRLWLEGEVMHLMDPLLENSCDTNQVMKCIHIGLLCVQEDAADRPTMSTIVLMLASDSPALPSPMKPAFSVGRQAMEQSSTSSSSKNCSIHEVTISDLAPR